MIAKAKLTTTIQFNDCVCMLATLQVFVVHDSRLLFAEMVKRDHSVAIGAGEESMLATSTGEKDESCFDCHKDGSRFLQGCGSDIS